MFVFVKVVEILVTPLNMVVAMLSLAIILFAFSRDRAAKRLMGAATAAMLGLAILPWNDWLLLPLENCVPPPMVLPDRVDGIVVLGGAADPVVSAARRQPSVNAAAERLAAMADLARRYPDAQLIYSGGSGSLTRQEMKEAPAARMLLDWLGIETGRVTFEERSRTTWENAVFTRDLALPRAGQIWLLVTSARHMPRALGAFRAAGWSVFPYPVDYRTTGTPQGFGFDVLAGADMLHQGLHEWLGGAYYRWRGWSDAGHGPAL